MSIAIEHVGEDESLIKIITDPALLPRAIEFGNSKLVRRLLDRSPEVDLEAATLPAMTPIKAACRYGCDRENLQKLIPALLCFSKQASIQVIAPLEARMP